MSHDSDTATGHPQRPRGVGSNGSVRAVKSAFDLQPYCVQVLPVWHDEETRTAATFSPQLTKSVLLLRVIIRPPVLPFVLHHEIPAIIQHADEIKIELVGCGLKAEGVTLCMRLSCGPQHRKATPSSSNPPV